MKAILMIALLFTATASQATAIASQYTCNDGSIIRLTDTTDQAQIEHKGTTYPVRNIEHGSGFVSIMAGVKNQKTIILDPPDLSSGNALPSFFATYVQNESDDTHTIECTADRTSRRLNW